MQNRGSLMFTAPLLFVRFSMDHWVKPGGDEVRDASAGRIVFPPRTQCGGGDRANWSGPKWPAR